MDYICVCMDGIIELIKKLIDVKETRLLVDEFCRNEYNKKFTSVNTKGEYGTFHYYGGFELISESKIKVNYKYGSGEYEYTNSFMVDLLPEQRDYKIDNIIDDGN